MLAARRLISSVRFYSDVQNNKKERIFSEIIDWPPYNPLKIRYPTGVKVNLGNILTPSEVKDAPIVKWLASNRSFYTLFMTDPDAPSRKNPTFREWHHWLVGNIPGCDVNRGEVLSEYIGARPTADTGLHRYIFLVYKQPCYFHFDNLSRLNNRIRDKRGGFSIRQFAETYKLGNPIAGNFFKARYDCYVGYLNKKLSENDCIHCS